MQLWKKMKKNRKGFTLVEIIVVLVILAILAAFTIPAMLGFVNDARGKASIAEAREVYVAAQAAVSEQLSTTPNTSGTEVTLSPSGTDAETVAIREKITRQLAGDITPVFATSITKDSAPQTVVVKYVPKTAKVSSVLYVDKTGKYFCTITYDTDNENTKAEFAPLPTE